MKAGRGSWVWKRGALFTCFKYVNVTSFVVITVLLPPTGYDDHHLRLNYPLPRPRNPAALPR